jgi:hypothetical protein
MAFVAAGFPAGTSRISTGAANTSSNVRIRRIAAYYRTAGIPVY